MGARLLWAGLIGSDGWFTTNANPQPLPTADDIMENIEEVLTTAVRRTYQDWIPPTPDDRAFFGEGQTVDFSRPAAMVRRLYELERMAKPQRAWARMARRQRWSRLMWQLWVQFGVVQEMDEDGGAWTAGYGQELMDEEPRYWTDKRCEETLVDIDEYLRDRGDWWYG